MKLANSSLQAAFSALCLAALLLTCGPAAAAHKFHTSFTEADYNAAEQSLQITLRTFPDDLEKILSQRSGRSISLDQKKEAGALAFAYLQDAFQLQDANGQAVKLAWVGMEAGVDNVWLYFEAKLPAGVGRAQLRNQWLFELYEDQLNLVNVKVKDKKQALTFERGAGFQVLD